MLGFLFCAFGRHRVKRATAHYDGRHFRGACRHCGIAMIKDGHSGAWRRLDAEDAPLEE